MQVEHHCVYVGYPAEPKMLELNMQSQDGLASAVVSTNEESTAAGAGLAGNDDLLRSVLAGCGNSIKILDLDGRLQFMSEGGKRVMEVEYFGKLKGCPWPDFWIGAGNLDAALAVETAKRVKPRASRAPRTPAKGTPRFWQGNQLSVHPSGEGS